MPKLPGKSTPEQRERLRRTLRSVKVKPPEPEPRRIWIQTPDCVSPQTKSWPANLLDRIWFMAKRPRRRRPVKKSKP